MISRLIWDFRCIDGNCRVRELGEQFARNNVLVDMMWMFDIQLGRCNLSPIQRIAVAEKYRPIYEKQAKKNLEEGGRKGGSIAQNKPLSNLTKPLNSIDTNKKLADIAGVKPTTYKMDAKVTNTNLGNKIFREKTK